MRAVVCLLVLPSCSDNSDARWDGKDRTCASGRLVASGLTLTKPAALHAEGRCRVVIVASTLPSFDLSVRDDATVEIRDSHLGGNLTALDRGQLALIDSRPDAGHSLVVYADGDARVTVTRSELRGDRPAGGNGHGSVTVSNSVLEGNGGETSLYTWGTARVQVRGGTLIGAAVAQDGGELDIRPARWLAPADDRRRTLHDLHCLATADARVRAALVAQPPRLGIDDVRACADLIAADTRRNSRRLRPPYASDAAAAVWSSQLLPFAGKAQQLRDYLAAGDDKDDAGKRGETLRTELAQLARRLDESSRAYAAAALVDRDAARTWLRDGVQHRLQQRVIELVFAAEDVCIAMAAADGDAPVALDRASDAATQLFDLLAAEPKLADRVETFWAPESGNATSWSALEAALRTLRDEVKRVRRDIKDRKRVPAIDAALGIAAALDQVDSHYSRLTFDR